MIYILRAPAYACQALVKVCAQGCAVLTRLVAACVDAIPGDCKECCGPCGQIFRDLGEMLAAVTLIPCQLFCDVVRIDGPLGGYVLLALVMNIPALIYALSALSDPGVAACQKAPLAKFCKIDAGLAAAHVIFAVYIKRRVDLGLTQTPDGMLPHAAQPTAKQLRQQVRDVALYDVGFAVYFFVFLYSVLCNLKGLAMVQACASVSWLPWNAAALQLIYAWLSLQYAVCWSCIQGFTEFMERCCPRGPWASRPRLSAWWSTRRQAAAQQQPYLYVQAPGHAAAGQMPAPSAPPLSGRL